MKRIKTGQGENYPKTDGFYMPAEFSPHEGCIMIWPERPGSWPYEAEQAGKVFTKVIEAIAESEKVYVAFSAKSKVKAEKALKGKKNIVLFEAETDDAWARDVAPTFVVNKKEERRCIDWAFNAWGGSFNGLYASWEKDNAFALKCAELLNETVYEAQPFVLEGGSIHSDGQGTVLVTEACLLSKGRNPELSKKQIEEKLCLYLGAEKVICLPRGIYHDETDEHVDNICAFTAPGEVVLAWTDNERDPQYALSESALQVLEQETDAKGRKFVVHKLPIPDVPVTVTNEDLKGYVFEEGEDCRMLGERLAASYVNFYFSNDSIILPAFGGSNTLSDERAYKIMKKVCPDRKIVQIQARDILVGGGNIHCITQQIPKKRGAK